LPSRTLSATTVGMKITFLGGVGTVTGSRFLITTDRTRLLVDCGLFQGVKALRARNRRAPGFEPAALDAVVLTHAHIDHSGYLPLLVREGFRGAVHCTSATRDLCRIMLPDAGYLQEEEARFANKKGFSRHHPAMPLYTIADAEASLKLMSAHPYHRPVAVGDLEVTFRPAGHILGASTVHVRHGERSILFSGDLGRPDDLLMLAPEPPPEADIVVMESTYGDRLHPTDDPVELIGAVAKRTLERRGILLIPSFAVGRAQTIVLALERAFERGLAPRAPVYVNSPMATRVSELYDEHAALHRLTAQEVRQLFAGVTFVGSPEDSKALNHKSGPAVIISASGMLTGGRVLHHLRAHAPNPTTTVLLPGYQAAGTRGEALLSGRNTVRVHGVEVVVRAEVAQLGVFSAHGDQSDLVGWLGRIPRRPREVLLVHGEPVPADVLRQRIDRELGFPVRVAEQDDQVVLR